MFPVALAADDVTASSFLTSNPFSSMLSLGIFGGIWLLVWLPVYIYLSWALMVIAQKTSTPNAWLAWIPIGNLHVTYINASIPCSFILHVSWGL